ncbi:MAG: hypothetical protein JWL95_3285 [Gemmatimonadetes bacterium]|nr:hypothetical protein [Gemmatimonadota bacterium]
MSPTAERRVRDLLLDALTVSSGAVDAISFLALGKVFSAFMTGNVAFLGMGVAGATAPDAVAVLTAIVGFTAGVYASTRIVQPQEGAGTWPSRVTLALGISLIAHAAFVGVWLASHGQPPTDTARVLLGAWALAMGMQSGAIRALHVEGVFTTAATATLIYLAGDLSEWPATAAERRRLAGVLVSLLVGATAGSLLLLHARIYAPVLPLVITVAVVAAGAIALPKRATDQGAGGLG